MKLSTFNKIEAVAKTVGTLTAIGGAHALQESIKDKERKMTKDLNASIAVATKESFVGQKFDSVSQRTQDRYANMRERITAPKEVVIQPTAQPTVE